MTGTIKNDDFLEGVYKEMKYFTKDLWDKLQSPDTFSQAVLDIGKKSEEYHQIFEGVKNRLSKKFLDIYSDEYFSHEILFASGSTVYIQFKNKNIFIDKL